MEYQSFNLSDSAVFRRNDSNKLVIASYPIFPLTRIGSKYSILLFFLLRFLDQVTSPVLSESLTRIPFFSIKKASSSIINGETDVPTLVSHSIFPLKSRKRVCPENDDISRPLFVITGLPPKSVIKEELPPIDAELKDLVQKFLPSLKSV